MKHPHLIWLSWLLLSLLSACQSSSSPPLPDVVDFNFHIKPILSDRCFACHGPDKNAREADLRLDLAEDALNKETDSGHPPFVAGLPEESEAFLRMIADDPDIQMPPPESNLTLNEHEIALIKKWIKQGATYKTHWSFIPPKRQASTTQTKNPIDGFIQDKLREIELKPAEKEDREKLLRRVSFDLTGLPPTPAEIDNFLNDDSSDAFEKSVDRLLRSPAYGERMASIWLDVSRYADSHGYQDDRPRTMWPWRDWVIKAYNDNLPYDQFITWQIAGDLLPDATYEQKLATGFNRNHAITQEGGVINEEYITEYVADRTNTMSTAFMGLTMECARCHDHKYDPISQKDYYQMFAFFNTIDERGQVNYFDLSPKPNMQMESADLEAQIAYIDSVTQVKETQLAEISNDPGEDFQQWLSDHSERINFKLLSQKALITWHKLDDYQNLATINEVNSELPGKSNIKLLHDLMAPVHVEGKHGKALRFDGDNYHSLGDVGDFEHWDQFSFGGWVKSEKPKEKKAGVFVRRNGEQKQAGYELVITPKGKVEVALIHNRTHHRIQTTTRKSISYQQWNHLFATYDGSGKAKGIKIYVNGILQKSEITQDNLAGKSILNGNDFLLGNYTPRRAGSGSYEGFKNGEIDEPRIYARLLSSLEVEYLASEIEPILSEQKSELTFEHFLIHEDPAYQQTLDSLYHLRRVPKDIPHIMIMEEMEEPRESFVLARGAYDAPAEKVEPGTPGTILPFSESLPRNRLGLAQWLTDKRNPLTARVAVNRLWQIIFGQGLVNTPEDFGNQGALPSHPELLDWLAVEFMDSDWDMKHMLKLMVMSETYQQAAEIYGKNYHKDPDNIYLTRGPYQKLSAEMIRDQALAASGLLHQKIGGHWVKPYQPSGIWKELANQIGENKYRSGVGSELYRRSLYSYWKRTIPPPVMLTFDASERAVCVVKRQKTNTPLQALVLLNDPQYLEASRLMAERMINQSKSLKEQLEFGFRLATSRLPSTKELKILTELFEKEKQRFETEEGAQESLLNIGSTKSKLDEKSHLAALTIVASAMLNLDETKMKS